MTLVKNNQWVPFSGNVPSHIGWSSEQLGLVRAIPAPGRGVTIKWFLWSLLSQSIPWLCTFVTQKVRHAFGEVSLKNKKWDFASCIYHDLQLCDVQPTFPYIWYLLMVSSAKCSQLLCSVVSVWRGVLLWCSTKDLLHDGFFLKLTAVFCFNHCVYKEKKVIRHGTLLALKGTLCCLGESLKFA